MCISQSQSALLRRINQETHQGTRVSVYFLPLSNFEHDQWNIILFRVVSGATRARKNPVAQSYNPTRNITYRAICPLLEPIPSQSPHGGHVVVEQQPLFRLLLKQHRSLRDHTKQRKLDIF
jgi:hypothetical protein